MRGGSKDHACGSLILPSSNPPELAFAATVVSTALSSNLNYRATLCHYLTATRLSFHWLLANAVCAVYAMTRSQVIASNSKIESLLAKVHHD